MDFELTAFDPVTKLSKLRVIYKTNNELWRFATQVPETVNKEAGNFYQLFWNDKEGTFSIFVNGVQLIINENIKDKFNLIFSLEDANRCDRVFSDD